MRHLQANIIIFTDGSAHDGNVGSAAILMRGFRPIKKLQLYLGKKSKYMVYLAEVAGLLLGAHLLRKERGNFWSVVFAIDNQATIQAMPNAEPSSSNTLLDAFERQINRIKREFKGVDITLFWVPGHSRVTGNELADVAAKEAASGTSSPLRSLPTLLKKPLPASKAAVAEKTPDEGAEVVESLPTIQQSAMHRPIHAIQGFLKTHRRLAPTPFIRPPTASNRTRTTPAPPNHFINKKGVTTLNNVFHFITDVLHLHQRPVVVFSLMSSGLVLQIFWTLNRTWVWFSGVQVRTIGSGLNRGITRTTAHYNYVQ
jgi:ribonuclease HI